MHTPRLRNQTKKQSNIYTLGKLPKDIIISLSGELVYHYACGYDDIAGDEIAKLFASSIDGIALNSALGLADILKDDCAFSVKSVKSKDPFGAKSVRIISGRCSPDYSYGISDPHADISSTGAAVLNIYNERINIAKEKARELRTSIFVRDFGALSFCFFEFDTHRYNISDYIWRENKNGNLEAYDCNTDEHKFTWQPHGSQFTIIYQIPKNAIKWQIELPTRINKIDFLKQINFNENWVKVF